MDELDRLAIQAACAVLAGHLAKPGSQTPENLESAIQILENCRHLFQGIVPGDRAAETRRPGAVIVATPPSLRAAG